MRREIRLGVTGGHLTGIDHGGEGPAVLLVHGTGHNAAAWDDVADLLVERCHPVAVDLRGHGQSPATSTDATQYWRDLGPVTDALSWARPVLVGHSTGGYAVTAAAAAGVVDPSAVCIVDGLVLDDRGRAAVQHDAMGAPEALEQLREGFHYGWTCDDEERRRYVDRCVRDRDDDWLNAGARGGLVEQVTLRSFQPHDDGWVRRPVIDEIGTVSSPTRGSDVYPSRDVYERLTCPVTIVLPAGGFYAARRDEVVSLVAAAPGRRLVDIPGNHNAPMTQPAAVAAAVVDLIDRAA